MRTCRRNTLARFYQLANDAPPQGDLTQDIRQSCAIELKLDAGEGRQVQGRARIFMPIQDLVSG
jgi:hypothetical protein